MQTKLLFSNWTQLAAAILISGAIAWIIKLSIIVSTNGQVIDTGAAALFMKIGIVLLAVGSTAIGSRLSAKRATWVRVLAMVLSPVLLFAIFFAIGFVAMPLFKNISLWYAQQEAPIAIAVVVSLLIGIALFRNYQPAVR